MWEQHFAVVAGQGGVVLTTLIEIPNLWVEPQDKLRVQEMTMS